ncbi:MAG: hypothetical protein ACR2IE_10130 [Candidatus Sumerlaeaceae bacterium]
MCFVKKSRHAWVLVFAVSSSSSFADRLHHVDGTLIEGRIIAETGEKIQIETKYGTLNYDRSDLVRVERTATAATTTSGTVAAAPVNLMRYIPQGPINPFAPPQVPLLVTLGPGQAAAAPTPAKK